MMVRSSAPRSISSLKLSICGLSCFAALAGVCSKAKADADYYEAFARASAAEQHGDYEAAARAIEAALRKYPGDYALTLRLGYIQLRLQHYERAEASYRKASEVSDDSEDAQVGLAWTLIAERRCEEALPILQRLLAQEPDDDDARSAVRACSERSRTHASLWASVDGTLYQHHPWKGRSADGSVGASLSALGALQLGGAYRYLKLAAADPRVPGYTQHEAYAEAGYAHDALSLLLHGAFIWSGDAALGGSRHLGLSAQLPAFGLLSLEVSGSWYGDLSVARIAPGWTVSFGDFSFTPAFAVQRFAHDTLASGSLTAAAALGPVSLFVSGKYGPEYRAAYLSQFAVFNSEDRSEWSVSIGAHLRIDSNVALFASYLVLGQKSADGVWSELHNLNFGTVVSL